MIRFISVKSDMDGYDERYFYKVFRRDDNANLFLALPLAIATSYEEAHDACETIIVFYKNGHSYTIVPPSKP